MELENILTKQVPDSAHEKAPTSSEIRLFSRTRKWNKVHCGINSRGRILSEFRLRIDG